MADNDFAAAAREWLCALDYGAEIRWGHDLARPAPGAHTGYIDVFAPDGCAACGTNWLVTIQEPGLDDAPADGVEVLEAPHDVAVRGRWEDHWFVDGTVEVLPAPAEDSLADGIRTRPAWSTGTLNAALRDWADRLAGRGDLVWVFDDEITSPMVALASERLAAIEAGGVETYALGDGVCIVEGAFDELLASGPDTAADIVDAVKSQLRH